MKIPFVIFPLQKAITRARPFRKLGSLLLRQFPKIKINLIQAKINVSPEDYLAVAIYSTLLWFGIFTTLMLSIVAISGKPIVSSLGTVFMVSFSITGLSFFYLLSYPYVQAKHRSKLLEGNLLYALRHILISVKSGITLFDAMAGVGREGYGMISEEFAEIVKEIHSGEPQDQVLEKTAIENPSPHFRSIIWQISNALKAGSDMGTILQSMVYDLERDQFAGIKKYNSEMNPWTMMYMLLAVIMPSLGITFMMVLSGFMDMAIGPTVFYMTIVFVVFFQVFFLSFMKTKRPVIGL